MGADIKSVLKFFKNRQPSSNPSERLSTGPEGNVENLSKGDVLTYGRDLVYETPQFDLLMHHLPDCLRAWQQDLMNAHNSDYAGFVEHFSAALAKHAGFRSVLKSQQYEAVAEFMKNAILDRIDQEQQLSFSGMGSSPYSWIHAIGTFGTVFPLITQLWDEWWNISTVGRACGVLQYASVFMYSDEKNPIFSQWTREAGGGPPCLWETDGHIYDQSWLPANIDYLRVILTPAYIQESIIKGASVLHGNIDSPIPELMISDLTKVSTFIELRIEEFLQYLALPCLERPLEWVTT